MTAKGQGHLLTFFKGLSRFKLLSSDTTGLIESKYRKEPPWDVKNANLFKYFWLHHVDGKNIQKHSSDESRS